MTSSKTEKHFTSCIVVYQKNAEFTSKLHSNIPERLNDFICRCAFNVFNVYEKLGKSDKKSCRNKLKHFKKDILNKKAFGNTALKMRCYGKVFWFIYKIFDKTVGRLLKGAK